MDQLLIRDGDDALPVDWFDIESTRPNGTVTDRNAFVTDLDVARETIAEFAACARARWKIENETFNILRPHDYHLNHHFGHGQQTLASVLVVLNLLTFALHSACDLAEPFSGSRRDSGPAPESAGSSTCASSPAIRPSLPGMPSWLCSPTATRLRNPSESRFDPRSSGQNNTQPEPPTRTRRANIERQNGKAFIMGIAGAASIPLTALR